MIKHIVMFKFKESAEGNGKAENIQSLKSKLEALPAKIAEIKFFEVGVNFSDVPVAYDLVLDSEFERHGGALQLPEKPGSCGCGELRGKGLRESGRS